MLTPERVELIKSMIRTAAHQSMAALIFRQGTLTLVLILVATFLATLLMT